MSEMSVFTFQIKKIGMNDSSLIEVVVTLASVRNILTERSRCQFIPLRIKEMWENRDNPTNVEE